MAETRQITPDCLADLIFHLKWKSDVADHTDCYHARKVNIWRDLIPSELMSNIINKTVGDRIELSANNGNVIPLFAEQNIFTLGAQQFDRQGLDRAVCDPRVGRFYPKGKLKGLSNIYSSNMQPFRCVGLSNGHMKVDFNHPLAEVESKLSAVVASVDRKESERGGTSIDWMDALTSGPGMQARWRSLQTDFFWDGYFSREDSHPDTHFYREPRFIHHLDATAREMVQNTYARFLTDGMCVLDLMSSWESHLPEHLNLDPLIGLGLNEKEMNRNSLLNDFKVHDLNADPSLPFDSHVFDAVINTASIEYLTDPVALFEEVARVLRPNGYFIVTFSNRWFPTKAIKIWSELHEFERMGLILEYFLRTPDFFDFHTYSIRGLPRPYDDKYFPELLFSDPVYAVWGRKK